MTTASTETGPRRLHGKSAVITGAAAGIGRATAELFAREGARLVLADINSDRLSALRDSLGNVTDDVAVVTADVSQPEDVRRMINVAVEQYGRLDIAIANAGIIPARRKEPLGTAAGPPSRPEACRGGDAVPRELVHGVRGRSRAPRAAAQRLRGASRVRTRPPPWCARGLMAGEEHGDRFIPQQGFGHRLACVGVARLHEA